MGHKIKEFSFKTTNMVGGRLVMLIRKELGKLTIIDIIDEPSKEDIEHFGEVIRVSANKKIDDIVNTFLGSLVNDEVLSKLDYVSKYTVEYFFVPILSDINMVSLTPELESDDDVQ